jgi:hypothetical protein
MVVPIQGLSFPFPVPPTPGKTIDHPVFLVLDLSAVSALLLPAKEAK